MNRTITILLAILSLLFAILSAKLNLPVLAFGVVIVVIVSVICNVYNYLDNKTIYFLIYALGLSLLLQTTLIGSYLIGTDVHTEFYFYNNSLNGWDTTIPHSYNTAIGTTVFAPFLTNVFGIDGYFIYKVLYPIVFAFVPVILYKIYHYEFNRQVSFLACIFFVTLPTYTLELIGLPRQMLGELMLALVLLLVIVRPIRLRYSVVLLIVVSSLAAFFHYVTFPAIIMYLIGASVLLLFFRNRQFPIRLILVTVLVSTFVGYIYYDNVAQGEVLRNLKLGSARSVSQIVNTENTITLKNPTLIKDNGEIVENPDSQVVVIPKSKNYFSDQEPLIKTALGLDFMEASITGKIFRIFQYLTEIALILGCWWLVRNRKKLSPEYIAFTITAIGLIGACIVLPRFSNMINVSRFYQLALFLISPLLIMGGLYIFRNVKVLAICLLIPYLAFTTGTVFEVTRETDTTKVNIPYSIALSNDRVRLVGEYTDNDINVRDYIVEKDLPLVLCDINSMLLMSEKYDPFTYLYVPGYELYTMKFEGNKTTVSTKFSTTTVENGWGYFPKDLKDMPVGTYIFMTEYNMENKVVTFKPSWYAMKDTASGLRQNYSFDFVNLDDDFQVEYRQGNATLLKKVK